MLAFKKIICPTDFSDPSYRGLNYAVELAKLFQAELTVVHVLNVLPPSPKDPNIAFSIPEYEGILHRDAEDKLAEILKSRVPPEIKADTVVGHGNAAKEIIRIAEENKADLIVIPTQGHTGWHHLLLGSVAEKVIRHAPCPVLAIREKR